MNKLLYVFFLFLIFSCDSATIVEDGNKETTPTNKHTAHLDFKQALEKHCGNAYEGIITAGGKEGAN